MSEAKLPGVFAFPNVMLSKISRNPRSSNELGDTSQAS